MDKIIVTVFDNQKNEFEGSKAVDKLHHDGVVMLYASGVITKNNNGRVSVVQEAPDGVDFCSC